MVLEPLLLDTVVFAEAVLVVTLALVLAPPTLPTADADAVAVAVAAPVVLLELEALVCEDVAVGPAALVLVTVAEVPFVPLTDPGLSLPEHPA